MPTRLTRFKKSSEYPPRVFTNRLSELMENHPDKPNAATLAAHVKITPLTMRRIIEGADVKLSLAIRISKLFGKSISEIWDLN